MRVHIVGASGSGTTTLGAALGEALQVPHYDVDDYYWMPTDPPFEVKRPVPERQRRLLADLGPEGGWVLSGSLVSWGDPFVPLFDLVVFRTLPHALRMERLGRREAARYGAEVIGPGGRLHEKCVEFLDWASSYDDPSFEGRSRHAHERWIDAMPCPVLRLDGDLSVEECVRRTRLAVGSGGDLNGDA